MANPRLTSKRLLLVAAASVSVSLAAAAEADPPRFETGILKEGNHSARRGARLRRVALGLRPTVAST